MAASGQDQPSGTQALGGQFLRFTSQGLSSFLPICKGINSGTTYSRRERGAHTGGLGFASKWTSPPQTFAAHLFLCIEILGLDLKFLLVEDTPTPNATGAEEEPRGGAALTPASAEGPAGHHSQPSPSPRTTWDTCPCPPGLSWKLQETCPLPVAMTMADQPSLLPCYLVVSPSAGRPFPQDLPSGSRKAERKAGAETPCDHEQGTCARGRGQE